MNRFFFPCSIAHGNSKRTPAIEIIAISVRRESSQVAFQINRIGILILLHQAIERPHPDPSLQGKGKCALSLSGLGKMSYGPVEEHDLNAKSVQTKIEILQGVIQKEN